jgi:hypothetical protein
VNAAEMLRLVGLEEKSKAKYKELSGGQKQPIPPSAPHSSTNQRSFSLTNPPQAWILRPGETSGTDQADP